MSATSKGVVSHRDYLLVEVPEGANTFKYYEKYNSLMFFEGTPSFGATRDITLPPGNYSIVGLAKDLTSSQKAELVEMQKTFGYRKYTAVNGEYQWTSLENSFATLLASHSLKEDTLILKKVL